ncbi:protein-L-isoaspartate carboxylmethyltransferase [Herbiconiux sp.]|jgi:hypothetical protein|uniref:protein-L-isoaspartate carboxylmethyltransferase n=1 Tax=Herbiconiux sp. TaxID=1871186 RepID=UPI0025C4F47B|nr:protein-L-isoaspartate carboxylmethyltransferase [Herbiconiux sp.]
MPFRSQETLERWVQEFLEEGPPLPGVIDVLRHDGEAGDDTGLVIVRLRNATTEVYLQPVAPGEPPYEVVFGAREHDFSLRAQGVQALADDLALAAALCTFLERKSREHLARQ